VSSSNVSLRLKSSSADIGCDLMWELITKVDRALSLKASTSSLMTDSISNLERIGSVSSTLSLKLLEGSYRPYTGFAAAMTEHLA
jgi:hypothetical protein